MSNEIELNFQLNAKDFRSAFFLYRFRDRKRIIDLGVGVGLFSIVAVLSLANGNTAIAYWIIGIVLVLMLSLLSTLYSAQMTFKRNSRFQKSISVRFTNDNIVSHTEYIDSTTDWKFYDRYAENRDLFVLLAGTQFTIIPKRAFTNNELEIDFRILLKRKIKGLAIVLPNFLDNQ